MLTTSINVSLLINETTSVLPDEMNLLSNIDKKDLRFMKLSIFLTEITGTVTYFEYRSIVLKRICQSYQQVCQKGATRMIQCTWKNVIWYVASRKVVLKSNHQPKGWWNYGFSSSDMGAVPLKCSATYWRTSQ